MKFTSLILPVLLLVPPTMLQAAETVTIPVDSPAFVFSPGNWVGDQGRSGNAFRQTWNPGAYFRVAWETTNVTPHAKILLDTSSYAPAFKPPLLAYCSDGVWKSKISCTNEITIMDLKGAGKHELSVYLHQSQQAERWGSQGKSGVNVLRVTGVQVDPDSKPLRTVPGSKWALIIGDSITEGCGATELAAYSHLVGQALQTQGYEYGINACGWSGWINRGDKPPGDVPGYYVVTNSSHGAGGQYDDALSRWDKIDGNGHALLDAHGHISAYGKQDQEPSLILINYGTNDSLHKSDPSDTLASMIQGLAALRTAAPAAQIVVIIPFGQYYARELKHAVEIHQQQHPADHKISILDLGPAVARSLSVSNGILGGLHPNDRGHALFAAKIIPQVLTRLQAAAP
jgi:lysophospholipase L1-like esterase